jgi:Uma2 family endonuclease
MSVPAEQQRRYTFEEYLRLEEASPEKHEFRHGRIVSMAGGTYEHALISTNVVGYLRGQLAGSPCRALGSDMRVRLGSDVRSYPDASAVCGPPQFDPQDPKRTTITNPRVIVEVLSPSTAAYDRGEKFQDYLRIESLQEYVLVSQDQPRVETFFRQPDGTWAFAYFEGLETVAKFRSVGVDVALREVYAGITFPAAEDEQGG